MSEVPPNYTNYPRPNYQTDPFSRPPGVYLDVIGDAWKLVQKELSTWVLSALVTIVISGAVLMAIYAAMIAVMFGTGFGMGTNNPATAGDVMAMFVNQFVTGVVLAAPIGLIYVVPIGLANMAVRQVRGLPISVGDVFLVFRRFGPVFGSLALTMLAYNVGIYLLIIPGLYAMAAFSLSPLIALNYDVGTIESMKLSAKALGSQAWLMIVLTIIFGLLVCLGFCLCGVGLLFIGPVICASMGLHFHYFFPPETNAPYVPTPDAPGA